VRALRVPGVYRLLGKAKRLERRVSVEAQHERHDLRHHLPRSRDRSRPQQEDQTDRSSIEDEQLFLSTLLHAKDLPAM
jgi:hypothetical protein